MDFFIAVLYGIIEGITEWLPVSSTGHLIIFENLLPFKAVSDDFLDMFRVVVQLGAILAVLTIFWKKIFPFDFSKEKKSFIKPQIMSMWGKIIVACVPAAIVGLLFDDALEEIFYNPLTVSLSLAVFGVIFIIVEIINKDKKYSVLSPYDISYKEALIIGAFQLIAAVFPGTSRSGATIIGALIIGISRTASAEFTFFLGIPVMFGASLLKIAKFVLEGNQMKSNEWIIMIIGFVVAYFVSVVAIRGLMAYVKKHDFKVFGWYRIILAVAVIIYFSLIAKQSLV
jgi:undecaprenyl-diphosphatase